MDMWLKDKELRWFVHLELLFYFYAGQVFLLKPRARRMVAHLPLAQ